MMGVCSGCGGTGKNFTKELLYSRYDERNLGVPFDEREHILNENPCIWCGGNGELDNKDEFTKEYKFESKNTSLGGVLEWK